MEEHNPYAPPQSQLEPHTQTDSGQWFYGVSLNKFSVLFIATMGMYSIYWFYAHWRQIRAANGERLWPVPRAIFNIFFVHSLFRQIETRLQATGHDIRWSPTSLATAYVVLALLGLVSGRDALQPWGDIFDILLLVPYLLILRKAQRLANLADGDPEGQQNANYSVWNLLWIVLGSAIWVITLIGYLIILGVLPPTVLSGL